MTPADIDRLLELEAAFIQRDEALQREEDRAEKAEAALAAAREENERLRATLDEIIDYRGGADSALGDPYVMDRARAALAKEPQALKVVADDLRREARGVLALSKKESLHG